MSFEKLMKTQCKSYNEKRLKVEPCRTCKLKRLTDRRNPPKLLIARWFCDRDWKLIGEGTDRDMEAAKGCHKWQGKTEITMGRGDGND